MDAAAISFAPCIVSRDKLTTLEFIPYAATLTNLFVKDKNGVERDVVLGYDNTTYYRTSPATPQPPWPFRN